MGGEEDMARNPYRHPEGTGFYPSFQALWHLVVLGVAGSLTPFRSAAWQEAAKARAVRVAVIDTPVAHLHPNLVGAIDLGLARDFSVFHTGAFVQRVLPGGAREDRASRAELLRLARRRKDELSRDILADHCSDTRARFLPSPYGGHGTAVAGLIGARPAKFRLRRPAKLEANAGSEEASKPSEVGDESLPFAGVNPFCRIVPISTTAAPDPAMVAGALRYARMIGAEVVVIAAEWADRIDREQDAAGWAVVDAALLSLCETAHVFCAAGNLKAPFLAYPASLSRPGRMARPWAVTACDETGRILTYAPDPASASLGGHAMLRCLSSEAPRFDREEVRLDPHAARDPDIALPEPSGDYPARHLVSTDPPGIWGYRGSPFEHDPRDDADPDEGVHYEIGSLFCRFSGTSAAVALAGGLVSLALALGRAGTAPEDPADGLFDLGRARAMFGR